MFILLNPQDYEGVVKFVLRKWALPGNRFYDMAMEALIIACNNFDENKVNNMKPQTFLIYTVQRYLGGMIGREFVWRGIISEASYRKHSYFYFLGNYHGMIGGANCIEELVELGKEPKLNDDYSEIEVSIFMENFLSPRERKIVNLRVQGFSMEEIGEATGCSRQNISLIIMKIKKKMIDYFGEEKCRDRIGARGRSEKK